MGWHITLSRGPWALPAAVLIVLSAGLVRASPARVEPSDNPNNRAVVIRFSDEVDNYTRDTLERRFSRARSAGAKTVILQIDTYGGLVTSALEISHFLKSQSDVHTIAYVKDKAISAGAMIAF